MIIYLDRLCYWLELNLPSIHLEPRSQVHPPRGACIGIYITRSRIVNSEDNHARKNGLDATTPMHLPHFSEIFRPLYRTLLCKILFSSHTIYGLGFFSNTVATLIEVFSLFGRAIIHTFAYVPHFMLFHVNEYFGSNGSNMAVSLGNNSVKGKPQRSLGWFVPSYWKVQTSP